MKERLADKSIILTGQLIGVIFILQQKIDSLLVVAMLASIIFLLITDIFHKDMAVLGTAVLAFAITTRQTEFVMLFPICIYSLCTVPVQYKMAEEYLEFYERKKACQSGQLQVRICSRAEKALSFFCILLAALLCAYGWFCLQEANQKAVVLLLPVFGSVYLALREILYKYRKSRLEENYDKSRKEAGTAIRARKNFEQTEEEHIYLATLQERNRIAREIHDNVGHLLTRAIVQMQAVRILNRQEELKPYLEAVDETVNQAMLNIRKSVHELHDDSIDISIMLNEIIGSIPKQFTVSCNTSLESPVSSQLKGNMLAIVKEAVTNLIKYSSGNRVKIELIEHTAFYRISIWDNGKNPHREYPEEMPEDGADGIGLWNIRQRSRKMGGRASIESGENGFTVLVTIPKKK